MRAHNPWASRSPQAVCPQKLQPRRADECGRRPRGVPPLGADAGGTERSEPGCWHPLASSPLLLQELVASISFWRGGVPPLAASRIVVASFDQPGAFARRRRVQCKSSLGRSGVPSSGRGIRGIRRCDRGRKRDVPLGPPDPAGSGASCVSWQSVTAGTRGRQYEKPEAELGAVRRKIMRGLPRPMRVRFPPRHPECAMDARAYRRHPAHFATQASPRCPPRPG
jgi:hypothetical protein